MLIDRERCLTLLEHVLFYLSEVDDVRIKAQYLFDFVVWAQSSANCLEPDDLNDAVFDEYFKYLRDRYSHLPNCLELCSKYHFSIYYFLSWLHPDWGKV